MITPASRCSCWNQIMPPLLQQKVKKSHTQFDNRIKYAPLSNHFLCWFFFFLFCLPLGIGPNYQNQRLHYQDYANIFRINNALFIFTVHSDCCFHTCALFFVYAGITFFYWVASRSFVHHVAYWSLSIYAKDAASAKNCSLWYNGRQSQQQFTLFDIIRISSSQTWCGGLKMLL